MARLIKGIDYENPAVRYRGERILSLLDKLLIDVQGGKPRFLDEEFAISIFYAFFLPYPLIDEDLVSSKDVDDVVRDQVSILLSLMGSQRFD